jgi:XTP/dITP diphosphohydrolase
MISRLVIATRNPNKVKEIANVLACGKIQLLSLNEYPDIPEVIEDGATFEENARKKATTIFHATGIPSLADDSGLEVDYLNGRPGVFSSRFAGEAATDAENNQKLLKLLEGVPETERKARFRCVMFFTDGTHEEVVEGSCAGVILGAARGKNGFGYDPLFYVPEFGQSFAEIEMSLKNQISHRGRALAKLKSKLNF